MKNAQLTPKLKVALAFLILLSSFGFIQQAYGQILYSRNGGLWTNTGAWSTTGHGGASCNCTPTSSNDVKIGAGHAVIIPSAVAVEARSIEVNDNGGGGSLTLGNNGDVAMTLGVGNILINTGGVISVGGNNGATHVITVTGNITNNGSFNMLGANGDRANVTVSGASAKSYSGSGATFQFYGLTIGTAGANVNISADITILNNLSWTADGLYIVDANHNLIVRGAATITGYNNARYIQLDGTNGANSQLIKINLNATAHWNVLYPIGTLVGGYTPLDLSAAGGAALATAPTNNSTLAVKAILNASSQGQMRRQFRLKVAGNTNLTTFTGGDFYYNSATDISAGDIQANYSLIWYLNTAAGGWVNVTGIAPGTTFFTAPNVAQSLTTGTYYYAIGNATGFTNTWYSYQTGVWSDSEVWTLDPSGTTFVNPSNRSPLSGDAVVILNGFTITTDVNNLVLNSTTIQGGGVLDMSTSSGHNLGTVTGTGYLRIKGSTLPSGTYTSFVSSSGGTIEYYDIGGTLTTQATYNKLIFSNTTGSAITFTSANNLTINGTLDINQPSGGGTVTWQINNTANTTRTISITGDVTVGNGGKITVGSGNSGTPHAVTLYGNLVNNGSIQFYDPTDGVFDAANYYSGAIYTTGYRGDAAEVTFAGVTDKTVTCNGVTDFYRLIVNKGTGQQAMLTVNSSNVANFRLFGPLNRDMSSDAPNFISDNALSLINGTLQLTGAITIPALVVNGGGGFGGGWPIPQNASLWVNSPDVNIQVTTTATGDTGRQLYVFGKLRLTDGTMNMGFSRGLLGGGSGVFVIEGGTLNTRQLRTTYLGSNNRFSYTQTGGTVNVGTATGVDVPTYPRFALPYAECSFTMSGGTLNVSQPTISSTSINGGILISAATSNIDVSGGQVNVFLPPSSINFTITSTAPFYNMNISAAGAGASTAVLNPMSFNDGAGYTRPAQPLQILNNLTLITGNTPGLTCNDNNVTIGGNFNIQSGTTFTPGANVVTFNGTSNQAWTHNGTITSLNSVVVNKTGTLQLTPGGSVFPNITSLTLTSGTLNDGGKTLTVTSTLNNSAVHSGTGMIVANGPTAIGGSNGIFGNLNIETVGTVTTAGDQTVTGNLRLVNGTSSLSIGIYNLTVGGDIYANATTGVAFTDTKRIVTSGARNDGGLTRTATLGQALLFPVGTTTILYTPVTIRVDAATTVGNITVRPVRSVHPNVTAANASLQYFWRVTSTGFTNVTDVKHTSYTFSNATKSGTLTDYHVARYDPVTYTWRYRSAAFNATGATVISPADFETGTGWTPGVVTDQLDGEYTAGNPSAFGTVLIYYSRVATGNWGTANSWSNVAINGTPAASTPCSTCPVVIGNAGNNHTININGNNQSSGSLAVATGSVLDCGAFTGLNFGENAPVSGNGKIRIGSANFPSGDFIDFIGPNGGTIEWYGPSYTIPSTGPAPLSIALNRYYNLQVSPNSGVTILMPTTDLTIFNNFIISGASGTAQVNTNTSAARAISVGNNFDVTSGVYSIRNGVVATYTVTGNTTVASGASLSVQNGGATRTHFFNTTGSLINNGTVLFRGGNELVNLTFSGTTDTGISGTNGSASTTLNNVVVNKGISQAPVLTIDVAGTVSTLSNNWLTLTNGTVDFKKTGGTFILTNTTNNPFSIPATTKLKVSQGTVTVSNINSNTSDVLLAGAIEVAGGTLNVGASGNNNNNDIEYAAAGSPTISVASGTLYVNGAIRRATTTLSGALVYNHTGGNVTVAGRSADNTRGVFEIENFPGSAFNLSGAANLYILRPTGGTLFPDLYLNPASSSVTSTGTIYLGIAGTTQTIDINIVPSLGNMLIYENTTASMQSSTLSTSGTLTINGASATLLTNSLDVTIGGDLAINANGIYNGTVGSGNTTIFNGSGAQNATLSTGSTFLNMTVNKPAGTVSLFGTSPTITNLNILSGTLDVTTLNLSVIGNIVNNSTQINTGGGSISLAGNASVTSQNITCSGGTFGNLTLTGAATSKTVNVDGSIIINGTLNFATTNRYLAVGSSLVTFGSSSNVTGAGNTAFIRTNGVSSDLGVIRDWAAGTSTFTYPVGTRTNYTPITFTLTVTTPGQINVIPVDDRHPTANTGSSEQILDYYWVINRSASLVYSATGSHVYAFPAALLGGAGGTLRAGYLDIGSATPGWITTGHGGTATTTSMTYSNLLNINLPTSTSTTFHYSVGTVNTLPNPITPIYSRIADAGVANPNVGGDWNDPNSWTLSPTGNGPVWGSIPYGNSVVILPNSRINISTTGRISFITQIDGIISLPSNKVGHNFGIIRGTGTMRTTTSTLPAGNYTAFVSAAGGTIEYVAPMAMNNRSTYNNLSVIGTGSVIMTNTDLTLNGGLTVAAGSTLNNTTNNRNISIARNWTNNGTVNIGTGTVTFTGGNAQTITPGSSNFYGLIVSKSANNVTLNNTTTVTNNLNLSSGHIIVSATNRLVLGTSTITGGSANSFIAGTVTKLIASGGSQAMPLGSVTAGRYRPAAIGNTSASDTWTFEYVPNSPANDGFDIFSLDLATLAKVSMFEYWNISRTGATVADLTLTYGPGSYIPPNIGDLSSLRLAKWNSTTSRWELATGVGPTGFVQVGDNIAGTVRAPQVTSFSPHTFGSTDPVSPLPIELIYFRARLVNTQVELTWETASEKDNNYFTVERTTNPEAFEELIRLDGKGTTSERSKYSTVDTRPYTGTSYYRLKQTDLDGRTSYSKPQTIQYEGPEFVTLEVYPNPSKGESFTVEILGLNDETVIPVEVINAHGQLIYYQTYSVKTKGQFKEVITMPNPLRPGIYLIKTGPYLPLIKKLIVE